MYSTIRLMASAGLLVASTAHAQGEQALLNRNPASYGSAAFRTAMPVANAAPSLDFDGERVLLGRVDHPVRPVDSADVADPIDGARALLGRFAAVSSAPGIGAARFPFVAAVRGDISTDAYGDAEFGAVPGDDGRSTGFVVSLGAGDGQSAVLFTGTDGTPLREGRYRISDRATGADEILALVTTGIPTAPTGVFRGQSGWLVVTAASDSLLTGRFQVDGVGFLAAEPDREDRPVTVTGSFSATAAGS
jgi:hypothetical protein